MHSIREWKRERGVVWWRKRAPILELSKSIMRSCFSSKSIHNTSARMTTTATATATMAVTSNSVFCRPSSPSRVFSVLAWWFDSCSPIYNRATIKKHSHVHTDRYRCGVLLFFYVLLLLLLRLLYSSWLLVCFCICYCCAFSPLYTSLSLSLCIYTHI